MLQKCRTMTAIWDHGVGPDQLVVIASPPLDFYRLVTDACFDPGLTRDARAIAVSKGTRGKTIHGKVIIGYGTTPDEVGTSWVPKLVEFMEAGGRIVIVDAPNDGWREKLQRPDMRINVSSWSFVLSIPESNDRDTATIIQAEEEHSDGHVHEG